MRTSLELIDRISFIRCSRIPVRTSPHRQRKSARELIISGAKIMKRSSTASSSTDNKRLRAQLSLTLPRHIATDGLNVPMSPTDAIMSPTTRGLARRQPWARGIGKGSSTDSSNVQFRGRSHVTRNASKLSQLSARGAASATLPVTKTRAKRLKRRRQHVQSKSTSRQLQTANMWRVIIRIAAN